MKHGCKWKCSSWSNNWVKWIIMYKVLYFLQEVSLVRLKVGDGRVNLAVLSSINSPEAKALAEQYPQCSNCPAKWRETSTVIVPIHSLSEALICSWAPQNANCRFVDLFTDLNLVLNWDLNEMCVAFKCLLPLSCRIGFLECLWWNSLRQIPPGVSGPKRGWKLAVPSRLTRYLMTGQSHIRHGTWVGTAFHILKLSASAVKQFVMV